MPKVVLRMQRLALLAFVASLTGCMSIPAAPAPPYHAVGTEPFWNLLIDEHNITSSCRTGRR